MKIWPAHSRSRCGLTLLELIVASTLMAMVVTSVALLVRAGTAAWQAHTGDYARLESAQATLRHLVRNIRQADTVLTISAANNNSGSLSLMMPSGSIYVWARNPISSDVNFGLGAASNLLAEGIAELSFTGYEADGVTATTTPAAIQLIRCHVRVDLPRESGGTRNIDSYAWLRSW